MHIHTFEGGYLASVKKHPTFPSSLGLSPDTIDHNNPTA